MKHIFQSGFKTVLKISVKMNYETFSDSCSEYSKFALRAQISL